MKKNIQKTTRIILVRHGETVENKKGIVQGHIHGTLTALGRKQAKLIGERLKKEKIDIIYVSDLERTKKTAQEIIKHHKHIPVVFDKRIRERNFGIFEGKKREIILAAREQAGKNYYTFTPENGESYLQLKKRVRTFYQWLLKKEYGKNILIVTHGGFVTTLFLQLTKDVKKNFSKYHPHNAAISIIEVKKKKIHIHILNCTTHLK